MSVRPHPTKHRKYKGEVWWIIDVGYGENRNRVPFKGTYAEAAGAERTLKMKKDKVEPLAPFIKELILPFKEWYKSEAAASTLKDFDYSIDLYFVPFFGNLRPQQLTPETFDTFKQDLLDKGLTPTTINKHLNYFSTIINWAVKRGKCAKLDFEIERFPKKRTTTKPKQALSEDEVDLIYKNIGQEYKILFLLMADHGLRQMEAMTMKIEDIDRANQVFYVKGKGNKNRIVSIMSDRFEAELLKIIKTRKKGYLAINPVTKKHYITIWKPLKAAATESGIKDKEINHHILRHSFATHMAERGMEIYALQELLGHESIETTRKIYTHIGRDFIGRQANKYRKRENTFDSMSKLRVISGGKQR